jgi:hypothetical protein
VGAYDIHGTEQGPCLSVQLSGQRRLTVLTEVALGVRHDGFALAVGGLRYELNPRSPLVVAVDITAGGIAEPEFSGAIVSGGVTLRKRAWDGAHLVVGIHLARHGGAEGPNRITIGLDFGRR